MQDQVKSAFKQSILKALPFLRTIAPTCEEQYLFWTKEGTSWRGEYASRTSLARVFTVASSQLADAGAEFADIFFSTYPQYGPGKLTGVAGLGSEQLAHNRAGILEKALAYLWDKEETFNCNESDVDAVVSDLEDFVDHPIVQLRFQAQLQNFNMPGSNLNLPEGLVIRRMNKREVSAFNGGPVLRGIPRSWSASVHEFLLEGVYAGTTGTAGLMANTVQAQSVVDNRLGKAILALRTFKEGYIGYDWVHFSFVKFCPLTVGSFGSLERHVRPGAYILSDQEAAELSDHARRIFSLSEPALETGCARLGDAESRLRPQDQILDAVIGMEALLLAALGKDERRGELKYRFSMNFAMLFDTPADRSRAYKVAKHLYDHRSRIAHGGLAATEKLRVGEEELNLYETAQRARSKLRMIIKRFLPEADKAPYRKAEFWERAYFYGLPLRDA